MIETDRDLHGRIRTGDGENRPSQGLVAPSSPQVDTMSGVGRSARDHSRTTPSGGEMRRVVRDGSSSFDLGGVEEDASASTPTRPGVLRFVRGRSKTSRRFTRDEPRGDPRAAHRECEVWPRQDANCEARPESKACGPRRRRVRQARLAAAYVSRVLGVDGSEAGA